MHRAARRLLTLLLGAALVAAPLTLTAGPAQAAPPRTTVVGWGQSVYGETTVPAELAGQDVTQVALNRFQALALTAAGKVVQWGHQYAPLPASLADVRVIQVASSDMQSYALTDAGRIITWGYPGTPTPPASLDGERVTAIAAGFLHALALTDDGRVTIWGRGKFFPGQQPVVPSVLSGKRVVAIAASSDGFRSMALTDQNEVVVWDDRGVVEPVPSTVADETVTAIAMGEDHQVALTDEGRVVTWGYGGDGSSAIVPPALSAKRVVKIAAGAYHSFAIADDGTLTTWGLDDSGQVVPPAVVAESRVMAVAGSRSTSLAVLAAPSVSTGVAGDAATVTAGNGVPLSVTTADATMSSFTVTQLDGGRVERSGNLVAVFPPTVPGAYRFRVLAQTDEGELENIVTITVRPAAVTSLHVTSPSIAHHGDTVSLTAVGFDRFLNPTGDVTADVTVASSSPADTVSGTDVTFGSAGARTLTLTHTPTGVTATRTVTVSLNAFTTAPAPTISGVVKTGETLTADAGAVAPTPESLSYQWLADGRTITGATGSTFTPGTKQAGARISVRTTARLTGYTDATVTSGETAPVAGSAAPSPRIDVTAAKQQLRRGQSTSLTWTSTDADRVTASGAWTGTKPATGRATVEPTLGTSVYRLTATNAAGTATAQVAVTTTRQATRLRVAATDRPVVRGTRTRLTVRGLDAREAYSVRIAGRTVARGAADARGTATPAVTLPWTGPSADRPVVVTGSVVDRTGRDSLAVVTGKLTATAKKSQARASTAQRITVRGLVPGQKVRITYRGTTVSAAAARASRTGTYMVRFDVGQRWGTKQVTVRAGDRSARTSFAVTPRHG